jgi:hypothetical protein
MAVGYFDVDAGFSIDNGTVIQTFGSGTPESAVTAPVGSIYQDTSNGALWVKETGTGNTGWLQLGTTEASTEDGYQNSFMGKTGSGSELPDYSSTNVVTDSDNLEVAIGKLDTEIGYMLAMMGKSAGNEDTVFTGSQGSGISSGDSLELAIDTIDQYIGVAPTPVSTRTIGAISGSADVNTNIDSLDTAIGVDVTSTNIVSTSSAVNANISALDSEIGAAVSPVTRTYKPISDQAVNLNIDALDEAIGTDAEHSNTNYTTVNASLKTGISELDGALNTHAGASNPHSIGLQEAVTEDGTLTSGTIALSSSGALTVATGCTFTVVDQPSSDNDVANKAYVDAVAQGLAVHEPAKVATTANLTATYDNGTLGVGATLTNSGTQAAISIDGVSLSIDDRVLVKDQSGDGAYEVTTIACEADSSGSLNNDYWWLFTRTKSYYVWYNVASGGTDPTPSAPAGAPTTTEGIEVAIATDATATAVGDASQVAIDAKTDFSATDDNAGTVTVTHAEQAGVKDAIDGNTGWTSAWTVTTEGKADDYQNGIYKVTTVGTASTNWVLTRTTDFDNTPEGEISDGDFVFVGEGSTNAGNGYVQTCNCWTYDWAVVGETGITWQQFSGAGQIIAGDGLDKTGNTLSLDLKANGGLVIESTELALDLGASSITGTLGTGDGGTGLTSFTGDARILVSTSSSALSVLDMSTNGTILIGGASPAAVAGATLAGDGLAATTGDGTLVLDADLKANGGLVFESNEIAVDLSASSITGTLSVTDGGTGADTSAQTDGQILIGHNANNTFSLAAPTASAVASEEGIIVNLGAGTISIGLDIDAQGAVSLGTGDKFIVFDGTNNKSLTVDALAAYQAQKGLLDVTGRLFLDFSSLDDGTGITLDGSDIIAFRGSGEAAMYQTTIQDLIDDLNLQTAIGSPTNGNLVSMDANGDIADSGLASSSVYYSGGTDVALADGGTGASLSDPNDDRIMFWDDSAGAVTWLDIGDGLDLTDTTISVDGYKTISNTNQDLDPAVTVDTVLQASVKSVRWFIVVWENGTPANSVSTVVHAVHNGATTVDWSKGPNQSTGSSVAGFVVDVTADATNMDLDITATNNVDYSIIRMAI